MDDKEVSLPLSKQDVLPKNNLDRGLFVLMTAGIPMLVLWELSILCTYYPEAEASMFCHLIVKFFLTVNVIGNLYFFQRIDSSAKRMNLPSVLYPSWKYCPFCQINCPPRAYHCPVCDECILKRDQHCMFAGNCVGFYNHRYYFMALIYVMTSSLYYSIFQWPICLEAVGGWHLLSLLSIAAPHIAVLFGFLSIYGFICAVTQIMLFCVFLLCVFLLFVQIQCITSGQTIHEKRANITLYDLGIRKNFIEVLGSKWYLAIFCPFFSSPLKGNGINFITYHELEEVKDV